MPPAVRNVTRARYRTISRLLGAGINVVSTSTTSLIYPPSYFATEWRDQLAAAAQTGGASFYASGIFPGFASDQLALLMSTQSKKIRTLTVSEIALNDHYPVADVMINGMGFARPLDFEPMLKTPGFIEIAWKAPIHLIADGLGVEVEEIRGTLDRELTDRDIEVAFGTIPAGTCGAVRTRAAGVVAGREAIVVEHIIRMARDVAPDWPSSECDATYRVDIEGEPDIHCAMTMGATEGTAPARGDGRNRDAGRERHPLRGGCATRAAQLSAYSEHSAASRVSIIHPPSASCRPLKTREVEAQQQREEPDHPAARGRFEPPGCTSNLHEMPNHQLRLDRRDQQHDDVVTVVLI